MERVDHDPSLDLAFRVFVVFDMPVEVFAGTEFTRSPRSAGTAEGMTGRTRQQLQNTAPTLWQRPPAVQHRRQQRYAERTAHRFLADEPAPGGGWRSVSAWLRWR